MHLHCGHAILISIVMTIQPLKACLASRRESFVRLHVLTLCSLVGLDAAYRRVGDDSWKQAAPTEVNVAQA